MGKARLEKMEYKFSVISGFYGNSYILSEVQRRLELAISEVREGNAVKPFDQAYGFDTKIKEERTKLTRWQVRRREYWLGDKYNYWSDDALAGVGLTREGRPLEKIKLEKVEYNFDVVSSYDGNDYILDYVQKWLWQAIGEVIAGNALALGTFITGSNKVSVDTNETHVDKWNVRRYYPDTEEDEGGEE